MASKRVKKGSALLGTQEEVTVQVDSHGKLLLVEWAIGSWTTTFGVVVPNLVVGLDPVTREVLTFHESMVPVIKKAIERAVALKYAAIE